MSLQVWLPLNGNFNNNGIANITITNNGATVNDNGKIGKCYSFNGSSNSYLQLSNEGTQQCTTECSVCFWVNITSWNTNYATLFQAGKGGYDWASYVFGILRNANSSNLCFTIWDNSGYIGSSFTSSNLSINTWYHLSFIYKPGHCLIYINGSLDKDYSTDKTPLFTAVTKTTIGKSNNASQYQSDCKMNDFRLYNHALSDKEVKELSKGLVLHYPLNGNGRSGNNIISNSTGYNGTTSWSGDISVGVENDKPYFITKRTNTTSTSRTFIYKLNGITSLVGSWTPGTKFTISGYYRIPSSETYNVQANLFIRWRLSTGSDSDSNFFTPLPSAAIKDKWIRFEQTFTVPTNYAGGSANFYLAAFTQGLSTVHWKNVKVELGEVATPWCPSSSDSEYTKMGYNLTTEYDTSGNGYNGSKIGATLAYDTDSARFSTSSIFNGTDNGILIENLPLSNVINTEVTYSFWIKPNGENGARSVYFGSYSGTSWSVEKTTGNILRLYWNGSPDDQCSGTTITDDIWQHICITKKGTSDIKVYINGVQKWSSTAAHNNLTFPTTYRIGRDTRSGDGTPYKGLMSDFRIYATALSADDVKALYNTSASISNTGVLMSSGEFVEA